MWKKLIGVVAGLAVWLLIISIAGLILRESWPSYASVADAMTFTLPMMIARLSIGAFATLVTGFVTRLVTRTTVASAMAGTVPLAGFIPQHITLWEKFPIWYHLTFLLTLVPLAYAGGKIAGTQ